MNNEPVAWKAYEEVHFNDQYILRWVREGDEYVNRMTKETMEEFKFLVEKELTDEEINKLAEEHLDMDWQTGVIEFARAILRKAQEKTTQSVMSEHCTCYKLGYSPLNNYASVKQK